ncbi:hypothetical protein Pcinc_003122 [Petrolisthes cinctipes]|uniref:Uncharacterized protein n=1 Tax=Petrolisthes cinctipes TaxID=88211 RepID=A0AAE1GJY6_PETCI|nr:hypothetical protein Pcinc_003122 [Petrolisthes cinctipes]
MDSTRLRQIRGRLRTPSNSSRAVLSCFIHFIHETYRVYVLQEQPLPPPCLLLCEVDENVVCPSTVDSPTLGMATSRANAPSVIADRGRIIGMWENGTPVSIIAEQTGFAQSTVYRWIERWQTEGSLETRPRSGRPRVLTGEVQEHLVRATQETPFMSSVQLTRHLELRCHPRTVRRTLHLNRQVTSVQAVERTAREEWEGVRRRPRICLNLVESIPSRLEDIVKAGDGWTSY